MSTTKKPAYNSSAVANALTSDMNFRLGFRDVSISNTYMHEIMTATEETYITWKTETKYK